jgi:hypothetical protein
MEVEVAREPERQRARYLFLGEIIGGTLAR